MPPTEHTSLHGQPHSASVHRTTQHWQTTHVLQCQTLRACRHTECATAPTLRPQRQHLGCPQRQLQHISLHRCPNRHLPPDRSWDTKTGTRQAGMQLMQHCRAARLPRLRPCQLRLQYLLQRHRPVRRASRMHTRLAGMLDGWLPVEGMFLPPCIRLVQRQPLAQDHLQAQRPRPLLSRCWLRRPVGTTRAWIRVAQLGVRRLASAAISLHLHPTCMSSLPPIRFWRRSKSLEGAPLTTIARRFQEHIRLPTRTMSATGHLQWRPPPL
mmetsp:Transcript_45593/g.108469  ORF Transcript_45593/g.108469 Transcript_45593/m.108469 type:complete len:268 (+) Transcript_45593:2779-3582(+)